MRKTLTTLIAISALMLTVTTNGNSSATTPDPVLSPELAQALAATAKYHRVEAAEADGYISINFCEPGEGCHWLNPSLIDDTFDPEHPEILLYAPSDDGWRLVAVEYVVPIALLPGGPPEGFTGADDHWREDTEGAGLWELTVWTWLHNPNGMFEQHNPRVP
jgi:hypothetical protein